MNQREVVIVSGVRTAIGDFGGSLKDLAPTELGARVAREALQRAGVGGDEVDQVVFGNVIHTEAVDMYLSRLVALNSGVSERSTALTLNRLCGSGLQAIVSAAQNILLGDAEIALAGGAESMSRAPYAAPAMRFGARMGDTGMVDMMVGALTDPLHKVHMGITAENVRRTYDISRKDQDELAVESHRRAARAIAEGRFREQILPVTLKTRRGEVLFDTDEHVRGDVTLEELGKLRPAFEREGGTVTAGNASSLNDGAAALLLMERGAAERRGLQPLARLVSYALAGVDPMHMGIGPVPASKLALQRAGLAVADLDVIEANEAFAAQACAVTRELGLDPARVNPNGSGISLGHPIGATGAIITVKALYELQRIGGRYALVTMCIGGGQGIAAIFERIG
ncbi:acetyl-CoA C-acyltransferase family protein [Pseudomonas stutzeri]|nr:acetyl-CoA C-acyltransferase family protein [Stutzerimonas stutzeri]